MEYMIMKRIRWIYPWIGTVLVFILLLASSSNAAEVTLIGEINDTQQLVADNQIYEVGVGEMGDYLVTKLISQKVKVSGELVEKDGVKTIIVRSYKVLED